MFLQIEDMKHIKRDFCSNAWAIAQGVGLGGAEGAQGVKNYFFEHGQVAYKIDFTLRSNW